MVPPLCPPLRSHVVARWVHQHHPYHPLSWQGKRLFFVTNNSTKSRAGYVKKFTSLGLNVKPVSMTHGEGHAAVDDDGEHSMDSVAQLRLTPPI